MEETLKWFETDLAHNIINSIIVILVSVIIYNIVHIIFAKGREKTPDKKISKKKYTSASKKYNKYNFISLSYNGYKLTNSNIDKYIK